MKRRHCIAWGEAIVREEAKKQGAILIRFQELCTAGMIMTSLFFFYKPGLPQPLNQRLLTRCNTIQCLDDSTVFVQCLNIFRWPACIWKLKNMIFFVNRLLKQWDNTFLVVVCCLVCIFTMLNRHYTVRHLQLDAIWSDATRCMAIDKGVLEGAEAPPNISVTWIY